MRNPDLGRNWSEFKILKVWNRKMVCAVNHSSMSSRGAGGRGIGIGVARVRSPRVIVNLGLNTVKQRYIGVRDRNLKG